MNANIWPVVPAHTAFQLPLLLGCLHFCCCIGRCSAANSHCHSDISRQEYLKKREEALICGFQHILCFVCLFLLMQRHFAAGVPEEARGGQAGGAERGAGGRKVSVPGQLMGSGGRL